MSQIVLVHGMCATKRSWNLLPAQLRAAGHYVINLTLPGHGNPLEALTTDLSDYVAEVTEVISAHAQTILIGHSMGGFVITQVAAKNVNRVSKLVYFSALMPKPGDTIGGLAFSTGIGFRDIIKEFVDAGAPLSELVMQPFGPLDDPFEDTQGLSSVPRHYIRCTNDGIVPPALQDRMISAWPGTDTTDLATGHLPQYENPGALEQAILAAL